jgi:hypothetical protein
MIPSPWDVLDGFGGERVVVVRPQAVAKFGGNAAILLGQFLYWQRRSNSDGWFWDTQADLQVQTGLTDEMQLTARKKLKQLGVLEERKRGIPARLEYRLNLEKLLEILGYGGNKIPPTTETVILKPREQVAPQPRNLLIRNIDSVIDTVIDTSLEAKSASSPPLEKPTKPLSEFQLIFTVIADACYGSVENLTNTARSRTGKAVKSLIAANFTVTDVQNVVKRCLELNWKPEMMTPQSIEGFAPKWRSEHDAQTTDEYPILTGDYPEEPSGEPWG